jgi:putative ABC transport system ATP-binding protein
MNDLINHKPIAQLMGVSKIYQGQGRETSALKDISFQAYPGEVILFLGPSGSGKSTFLTILAGLQGPTSGEAWLFGQRIREYSAAELQKLRASRIGFIFQTFHLIESLNAMENILLVMRFNHINKKDANRRAIHLLERFGIEDLIRAYPRTMSQGEKQRVAVARALANNASLIIADEPTGSLATEQGMNIVSLLRKSAKTENRCVIIASHDQRIADYADRVMFLKDGELCKLHDTYIPFME